MLTPPSAALTPVQTTKLPYCVPYNPCSPRVPVLINASLIGPLTIFPIPLPIHKKEKTIELSICPVLVCTALMMPGQVFAKLPAKSPYVKQKISNGGREVLKPQIRKVEIMAPMVEMRMAVVTCVRSMMLPMLTDPMTAATLRRMRGTAEIALLNPNALVYVGRSECWSTKSVYFSNAKRIEILTNRWYKKTQALQDVSRLQNPKGLVCEKVESNSTPSSCRDREPWFDKDCNG